MSRSIAFLLFATACQVLIADDATETKPAGPVPAIVDAIESKYSTEASKADAAVAKAEQEAAKAKKAAADARLKAYRDRLTEITKSGDFDKAIALKARIEQLEKEPDLEPAKATKRPRPKDVVKFQGRTYALIKEPATWHVAKKRCEEMGGHLACIHTLKESAFVSELCRRENASAWIGATDEESEGEWRWVTGGKVSGIEFGNDNAGGNEHFLAYWLSLNQWQDLPSSRLPYVCEWDS